jgi:hypothetical protein
MRAPFRAAQKLSMSTSILACNTKYHVIINHINLTPKGRSSIFGPFLKFGQAIVDAIFVQKISNFW